MRRMADDTLDRDAVATGLACTLPPADLPRRADETRALFARATDVQPTADGATLVFSGDDATARALLELVLAERRCCAALTFELRSAPDHRTTTLHISGSEQHAAAIHAWVAR